MPKTRLTQTQRDNCERWALALETSQLALGVLLDKSWGVVLWLGASDPESELTHHEIALLVWMHLYSDGEVLGGELPIAWWQEAEQETSVVYGN